MHDLVIVGAGGFGREVLAWAKDTVAAGAKWKLKGFLDDNPAALTAFSIDVSVVGTLTTYQPAPHDRFICAIGRPAVRRKVHAVLTERGGVFVSLVHPTAIVAASARLGAGVILCPFALVSVNASIGEGTAVYYHSSVDHDACIGRFCQISAHCDITGAATIGDEVFLGSHASILPGISIGNRTVVGAGAVVTRPVGDDSTYVGVPARPIRPPLPRSQT
jgi:sugar O-acyltransferase (sialic acid O-acetyltransferase NeuD family)